MKTEKEIAESAIKKLSKEDIEYIRSVPKNKIWSLHHTLGQWVRNTFYLWERKWEPELIDGVDWSPDHPDAISSRIVDLIHEKCQTS